MKFKFFFIALVLVGGLYAYAEELKIVSEPAYDGALAANTIGNANIVQVDGVANHNKNCSCRCTAQGILLRDCGSGDENLGNYGNIQNCNIQKEKHPQCN